MQSYQTPFSTCPALTDNESTLLQYMLQNETKDEFDELEINFQELMNAFGFDEATIKALLDSLMDKKYSAKWDIGMMYSSIVWSYIILDK